MNVKRLDGRLLNYWIATSAGLKLAPDPQRAGTGSHLDSGVWHPHSYNPANDWSQAGAIVADEWFAIEDTLVEWFGPQWPHLPAIADNPLKWFMRAYVATQFGNEVEDHTPFGPSQLGADDALAAPPVQPGSAFRDKSFIPAWLKQFIW